MTEWSDEQFDDLWNHVPGSSFYNETETRMYQDMLDEALEASINGHQRIDETQEFRDFLEELGLAVEDFDWEYFKEWVEAAYDEN